MEFAWEMTGKIIWLICVVTWGVIRFRPNVKSRKTEIAYTDRSPIERFSMLASQTGLGLIPANWIFTGFPSGFDRPAGPLTVLIGLALFLLSLYLFRRTHKDLGKMWSHSLDLREGHKLVSTGIYKRLRHPMYLAFWLWALAQFFLMSNWIVGLAGIVGFGTLYFLRVGQEERMMEERFGQEYRDYAARTHRIIPGVY